MLHCHFCFSENSQQVATLRKFKFKIQNNELGYLLIDKYYRYSPKLIEFCEKNRIAKKMSLSLFLNLLY